MLNNKQEFTIEYGGKTVVLETGRLAKQTDGSVLVTCGGTQVLSTVCSATESKPGQDFFPLLVDYKEKYYSAGKFLGGFRKREGRPSDQEILLMRMIDRPFRPMFPKGYFNETIIMNQVLSYDEDSDPQILAGLGAAACLAISDIPFEAPAGFAKIGYKDGNYIFNPSKSELEDSELDMIVAASEEAILMVEGEALELSEDVMLGAITFAHTEIKKFCKGLAAMKAKVGKPTREFTSTSSNDTLIKTVAEEFKSQARELLSITDKTKRSKTIKSLTKTVEETLKENPTKFGITEDANFGKEAYEGVDELLYEMMRADILTEDRRIGGRGLAEVRAIETEISCLKKVHGSALFTRGETQVIGTVTVGSKAGAQLVEDLNGVEFQKFYLHYTFAPFCVGEARGYRGVGRREVGHGNLAERAIKNMISDENPYTIRVACEVLESNGSSSMGSVCSGSMALMDAGVKMKAPVAGIAMGLIKDKESDNYKILTDILGDEDHLGDMDFKVAGTKAGITAIQMDIKITGINEEILSKAMTQAKEGRLHILDEMNKTINTTRTDLKDFTPRIEEMKVKPDQIGMVIGPGGKNVKALQENYNVTVECNDDGTVKILGDNAKNVADAIISLDMNINGPKIGEDYDAVVVTIKEYGAFVDIMPGVSGLVHVSEMADERVNDVNEYVSEGDKVKVKVLDKDKFGKTKLSIKAIAPLTKKS